MLIKTITPAAAPMLALQGGLQRPHSTMQLFSTYDILHLVHRRRRRHQQQQQQQQMNADLHATQAVLSPISTEFFLMLLAYYVVCMYVCK